MPSSESELDKIPKTVRIICASHAELPWGLQENSIVAHLQTDNGPAYTNKWFKEFYNLCNINHITEIPYNPHDQAGVEWHHHRNGKF